MDWNVPEVVETGTRWCWHKLITGTTVKLAVAVHLDAETVRICSPWQSHVQCEVRRMK